MEMSPPMEIPAVVNRAFIEYTKSDHDHGGEGWEFGTCLWSPSVDAGGRSYSLMREPTEGDLVVHFMDRALAGYSWVARPFQEIHEPPPSPGPWADRPSYFRIDLRDFTSLPEPVTTKQILATYAEEIEREVLQGVPTHYPFHSGKNGLGVNQGQYLTILTPNLFAVFNQALQIPTVLPGEPEQGTSGREDYSEGKRRLRETSYFARNPKLVRDAKEKYGYVCQVCGFDYGKAYGELGEGYIEVHHLNPLSERPETEEEQLSTNLDEVMVVCANCHRMLHRKSPALDPAVVKECLSS